MILVNNLTKINVSEIFLKRIAKFILKEENKEGELSITLVSPAKIKELNRKYRRKNRVTDILSFESIELGEIIICPLQIKKNSQIFNTTFKKELTRVLIHGVLHLLGYNHEKSAKETEKMKKKENYYFSRIFPIFNSKFKRQRSKV